MVSSPGMDSIVLPLCSQRRITWLKIKHLVSQLRVQPPKETNYYEAIYDRLSKTSAFVQGLSVSSSDYLVWLKRSHTASMALTTEFNNFYQQPGCEAIQTSDMLSEYADACMVSLWFLPRDAYMVMLVRHVTSQVV